MWPFRTKAEPIPEASSVDEHRRGAFLTHGGNPRIYARAIEAFNHALAASAPKTAVAAMDSAEGIKNTASMVPPELLAWYASQRFIGHQTCAMLAQHWLVDKACAMPARDAVRNGFDIQAYAGGDDPLDADTVDGITDRLMRADRKYRLRHNMQEFIRQGRIFGVRVAFFKVDSDDPDYYENPYNPDGVTAGSYRGIVQVDPYWCTPELSGEAASDPSSIHFYEPEWWIIRGKRFHRSHLVIFRNGELPDVLKPMYGYGGVPVPQRVYERVYAAERTANEGPQLAMTKRTMVQTTDLEVAYTNQDKFIEHMQNFAHFRDNYGVKLADTGDTLTQFDTALGDLDTVIMTQYQLVASAAGVPATKLLGTTPKGFNATGEYEAQSYHEELETIQANDLTDLVNRHHEIVMRSDIDRPDVRIEIDWRPVDSPTAKERAEINKLNADTDNIYVMTGAIDGDDVRGRLRSDPSSGYADLDEVAPRVAELTLPDDPADLLGGGNAT